MARRIGGLPCPRRIGRASARPVPGAPTIRRLCRAGRRDLERALGALLALEISLDLPAVELPDLRGAAWASPEMEIIAAQLADPARQPFPWNSGAFAPAGEGGRADQARREGGADRRRQYDLRSRSPTWRREVFAPIAAEGIEASAADVQVQVAPGLSAFNRSRRQGGVGGTCAAALVVSGLAPT